MENILYMEQSVLDLRPKVVEFLKEVTKKVEDITSPSVKMKKKELGELVERDVRTVSRYLNELEEDNVIELRSKRGREGGTIILFNTEKIKFKTSDKSILTREEEPEDIDEMFNREFPTKPKKEKTRNRRTAEEMVLAKAQKQSRKQKEIELNEAMIFSGGLPDNEWFQKTEDPIGNYKAYLLSRLYNRYAVLITNKHNQEVEERGDGVKMKTLDKNFDSLPMDFVGKSQWTVFKKLQKFLDENNIKPSSYFTAIFSRISFLNMVTGKKYNIPYVNTLMSDETYKMYTDYKSYGKKAQASYATTGEVSSQFGTDYVIKLLREEYDNPTREYGFSKFKTSIKDFLKGNFTSVEEIALANFYKVTDKNMKKEGVSLESREVIKKFLMFQSLALTKGINALPIDMLVGSEITRAGLKYIDDMSQDKETAQELKAHLLGGLKFPNSETNVQMNAGKKLLEQVEVLGDSNIVVTNIHQKQGLYVSTVELRKAIQEYGRDKLPITDLSTLDINQVKDFVGMESNPQEEVVRDNEYYENIGITNLTEYEQDPLSTGGFQGLSETTKKLHDFYDLLDRDE